MLPIADGPEIRLRRVVELNLDLAIRLDHLGLQLPKRPRAALLSMDAAGTDRERGGYALEPLAPSGPSG